MKKYEIHTVYEYSPTFDNAEDLEIGIAFVSFMFGNERIRIPIRNIAYISEVEENV